jgi:hypothetical protein
MNAMSLSEFLKDHQKVERLKKQVERLAAGLLTVSEEA